MEVKPNYLEAWMVGLWEHAVG